MHELRDILILVCQLTNADVHSCRGPNVKSPMNVADGLPDLQEVDGLLVGVDWNQKLQELADSESALCCGRCILVGQSWA